MNHKIFLLDDDIAIRSLLSTVLENAGFEIFPCDSASQAKQVVYEHKYSVLIIDIILPDLNGIDFIKEIQESGIDAPIIVITGSSEVNYAREAVRLKVFDYLVKPFKTNQFMQVVNNAILHFELDQQKREMDDHKRRYQEELERIVDQKVFELRESENRYKSLVEQSLVGVYLIQDDLIRFVNKKFCEIFGCNPSEIINKISLVDLTVEKDKNQVNRKFAELIDGTVDTSNFELHAINKVSTLTTNRETDNCWDN